MGVYFHQDLHVARLIHQRKPVTHLDVGSRVDGFVSHLLTFMDVTSIDVRPLTEIKGMKCIDADARALDMFPDGSVPSLSCLHSLEHFGLGRYGDEVDPLAWEKALSEMIRVLAPRGCFYLSVPVGKERVEFNAQRVFSIDTVLKALDELNVVCVTLIGQDGLIRQVGDIRMLYEAKQDEGEGTVAVFEALKSYQSSG
jgi:predicted SAM-dependent methyltransferase